MKRTNLGVSTILMATIAASTAWAQTQLNQNGQAIDASLQTGSSGYNRPSLQQDFRARNDLITGNVSGGRAFQDNVGYGSPGSFGLLQVPLTGIGGDEAQVFRFRRDALASSPHALAGTRVGSASVSGNYAGVFRNTNAFPAITTGGQIVNPDLVTGSREVVVVAPAPTRLGTRITNDSVLTDLMQIGSERQLLNHQLQGSQSKVHASPLLGLRQISTTPGQLPVEHAPHRVLVPGVDADLDDSLAPNPMDLMGRSPLSPDQLRLSAGFGASEIFAKQPVRVAPGLVLGQQLQLRVDPMDPSEDLDNRVKRLKAAIYSPLGSYNAEPGQDIYLDLLMAIQHHGQTQTALPNLDEMADVRAELAMPSTAQIEEAEQTRDNALRKRLGIEPLPEEVPSQVNDSPEATPEDSNQLQSLMVLLNYDLPRLKTLAGHRQSRANELIAKAEKNLASGQYFSAERQYRQAMIDAPKNPLIRAGLLNSQIGAGMIRSAAHNLRILCERHPELIATRYSQNLLPNAARIEWLQGELRDIIKNPASSSAPGLMLAYLGYQIDSRQLVRYGLAVAESRSPKDPLLPLLRNIWLDETRDGLVPGEPQK